MMDNLVKEEVADCFAAYRMVYSTDRSKAVIPVLVLVFVVLCVFFYEAILFLCF